MINALDADATKKTIRKIRSLKFSSYLVHILLSVFMMISIVIIISCSISVAAAFTTKSNVHQNSIAKSAMTLTSLSSSDCNAGSTTTTTLKPSSSSSSILINNKTLSVLGKIDLTNSSVRLEPFMVLPGSKYTTRPANSSFSINLLDSEGRVLARYPFNPKVSTYIPENRHNVVALLSEAVPYNLCTKQIMISKDGQERASVYVSPHVPQVRLIFPNGGEILEGKVTARWQASDADGDNLTYSLLYSTDNGHTWQNVAKNIKDSNLTVDLKELPGGTKALFRIIATDGVNTAIDDSDHTFTVPSGSPAG